MNYLSDIRMRHDSSSNHRYKPSFEMNSFEAVADRIQSHAADARVTESNNEKPFPRETAKAV